MATTQTGRVPMPTGRRAFSRMYDSYDCYDGNFFFQRRSDNLICPERGNLSGQRWTRSGQDRSHESVRLAGAYGDGRRDDWSDPGAKVFCKALFSRPTLSRPSMYLEDFPRRPINDRWMMPKKKDFYKGPIWKKKKKPLSRANRLSDATKKLMAARRAMKKGGREYMDLSRMLRKSLKDDIKRFRQKKGISGAEARKREKKKRRLAAFEADIRATVASLLFALEKQENPDLQIEEPVIEVPEVIKQEPIVKPPIDFIEVMTRDEERALLRELEAEMSREEGGALLRELKEEISRERRAALKPLFPKRQEGTVPKEPVKEPNDQKGEPLKEPGKEPDDQKEEPLKELEKESSDQKDEPMKELEKESIEIDQKGTLPEESGQKSSDQKEAPPTEPGVETSNEPESHIEDA